MKRRPKEKRNELGFSMVEMLVALVLITIVLSGTLAMQVAVIGGSRDARSTSAATTLLQSGVEMFRAINYDNLTAGGTVQECFSIDLLPIPSCDGSEVYMRQRQITQLVSGDGFQCFVLVQYVTPNRDTEILSLTTERRQ